MSNSKRSYLSVLFAVIALVLASSDLSLQSGTRKSRHQQRQQSRILARWMTGFSAALSRRKTSTAVSCARNQDGDRFAATIRRSMKSGTSKRSE